MWWRQREETGLSDSSFPSRPRYREGSQGLLSCYKIAQFFPLTWSYVQLRENWACSLICSSLNVRCAMKGQKGKKKEKKEEKKKKREKQGDFLSPSSHTPKTSGKIQILQAASWWLMMTRPKRKRETVRKRSISLNAIQRFFFPPTLFPFSNLGPGFPHNWKGCAI